MKQYILSVLFVFAVSAPAMAEDAPADNADVSRAAAEIKFPPWPPEGGMQPVEHSDYVPPPPGPYMSNALTAMDVGFSNENSAPMHPMESVFFKPDMAWPERRLAPRPERWEPEEGYRYVPDEVAAPTPLARHLEQPYGYPQPYMQPYGWGQTPGYGQYAPPPPGYGY